MPKPQLKNIEEHLQFLVGERNPFTEPDHLEKIRLYITKQFESFNLSVNQEAIDFEKQLKGWTRKKKEALINGEFELLPILSKKKFDWLVAFGIVSFDTISNQFCCFEITQDDNP